MVEEVPVKRMEKYMFLRNFQFDQFPKSKINSKCRFESRMYIFLFKFLSWRVSVNMKWLKDQVSQKRIEEVSMKWIDRQIAKKKGNATDIDQII